MANKKPNTDSHPAMQITLDAETARQYKLYAAIRHIEVDAIIRYALRDWMESIGVGHIEDALGVENESTRMSFGFGEEREEKESPLAACDKSRMN